MNDANLKPEQAEEENLLTCDIADETLEAAADTGREIADNITWYYCPTGLIICRV
jgi:hypothetical protein